MAETITVAGWEIHKGRTVRPDAPEHDCFLHRRYFIEDGDDVKMECCGICGRVRHERGDGVRPMAWYIATNPETGFPFTYAYDDPRHGTEGQPEVWKYLPGDNDG